MVMSMASLITCFVLFSCQAVENCIKGRYLNELKKIKRCTDGNDGNKFHTEDSTKENAFSRGKSMFTLIDKDIKNITRIAKKKNEFEQSYNDVKEYYNKLPAHKRRIIKAHCQVAGVHAKNDDTFIGFVGIMMSLYTIIITVGLKYLDLIPQDTQNDIYRTILGVFAVLVVVDLFIGGYYIFKLVCGKSEKRFIKIMPIILAIEADDEKEVKESKTSGVNC